MRYPHPRRRNLAHPLEDPVPWAASTVCSPCPPVTECPADDSTTIPLPDDGTWTARPLGQGNEQCVTVESPAWLLDIAPESVVSNTGGGRFFVYREGRGLRYGARISFGDAAPTIRQLSAVGCEAEHTVLQIELVGSLVQPTSIEEWTHTCEGEVERTRTYYFVTPECPHGVSITLNVIASRADSDRFLSSLSVVRELTRTGLCN